MANRNASECNKHSLKKNGSHKFDAQKQKKVAQKEKDPMELELVYNRKHLTKRMDRMKEALGSGQIVNHKRLQHAMGSELDYRKKNHDKMLQQ